MSDANTRMVVLQDTHSLFGRGAATAVTFVQHQCDWLWAGDAKSVVLDVEVFDITPAVKSESLDSSVPFRIWSTMGPIPVPSTSPWVPFGVIEDIG